MEREKGKNGLYVCPCCGYATLEKAIDSEICDICYWEDDGQDDPEANEVWGGPNHVSLIEGRINFLKIGASDPKDLEHVRAPSLNDENLRNYSLEKLKNGKNT
jgi:hypothetical protein